jgi:hypothetical protein
VIAGQGGRDRPGPAPPVTSLPARADGREKNTRRMGSTSDN